MQNDSTFALEINGVSPAGFAQAERRGCQSNGMGTHPLRVLLGRVTPVLGQFEVCGDCQGWTEQETQGLSALQGKSPSSAPPEVLAPKGSVSPKRLFIHLLRASAPFGKTPLFHAQTVSLLKPTRQNQTPHI